MVERQQGSIINISSVAGLMGSPGMIAYGASKWAVRGMTKSVALEVAPFGVRVNSIHPGIIETPMLEEFEKWGIMGAGHGARADRPQGRGRRSREPRALPRVRRQRVQHRLGVRRRRRHDRLSRPRLRRRCPVRCRPPECVAAGGSRHAVDERLRSITPSITRRSPPAFPMIVATTPASTWRRCTRERWLPEPTPRPLEGGSPKSWRRWMPSPRTRRPSARPSRPARRASPPSETSCTPSTSPSLTIPATSVTHRSVHRVVERRTGGRAQHHQGAAAVDQTDARRPSVVSSSMTPSTPTIGVGSMSRPRDSL